MKKNFKYFLLTAAFLSTAILSRAQGLDYESFMRLVAEKNAEYLAEQYNVNIAEANLKATRVFNDPEFSVDYSNNEDWKMDMGQSVEVGLGYDFSFGRRRHARIILATNEKYMTEASLAAYFSNLRAEAAMAWAEAWRLREMTELLKSTYENIKRIAVSDSVRLSVGDVSSVDAKQSSIEAEIAYSALAHSQHEYKSALIKLGVYAGGESVESIVEKELPISALIYDPATIYDKAEANRADLKVAEYNNLLSESNLKLLKAERAPEFGLSVGYSYNTWVENEIAPAPKFNGMTAGVSIPLKFSNANRGAVVAARHDINRSRMHYNYILHTIHGEVSSAYNAYVHANEIYARYDTKMLEESKTILENRRIGYLKGESSLTDLLQAQTTYNDFIESYINICVERFVSEVELRRAIGE